MKRLRKILQSKIPYIILLVVSLIGYFIQSNIVHASIYKSIDKEKFIISNKTIKDYGIKYELKGKEKVLGFIYCDEEEIELYDDKYGLGDKVEVTGEIKEIDNNTVPNTFNYKKYLNSNKIYTVIDIKSITKVENNKNFFYKVKNVLLKRGDKLKKSSPYIDSLIFGNNSYIDEDTLLSYRENGISHLFAISGLHISIFLGVLSKILEKLKLRGIKQNIILIVFLLFYMFLTNFSMSVMRGAILTILLMINKMLKLKIPTVNLLILALCIIMVNNPLNINNIGLMYSFLVTLFLILFKYLINTKNKFYSLFMISLIAFLVSYPITINNFYKINYLSVIYNLFFVPYVSSVLLPFTLISYLFPGLDSVLYLLIKIIEFSSHFLDQVTILKVSNCKMGMLTVVIYFVIICKLFLNWNTKRTKFIIILIMFFILHSFMPFSKEDYVMYLDVGQGDSTLININGNTTLIDTGGQIQIKDQEYKYKIAKNKLVPYLNSVGIKKLDNLVLTHGDADHMKEALYLVNHMNIKQVVFNCGEYNNLEYELIEALRKNNINYKSCVKELKLNKYKLEFLNTKTYNNENDNSSVIYLNYQNKKFIFMGDAGVKKEIDIMEKYELNDIDFIKVGHHGSNTSSSKEFIEKINPKNSVISVGKNNRYGHPKDEVLETLKNTKIYRTDVNGSIKVTFDDKGYKVRTYDP